LIEQEKGVDLVTFRQQDF
jgi:hypothetical protein